MATIWKVLTRKKVIDPVTSEDTRLSRVLNTFDLTALGVGSTLGVGVYVLAGHVAKETAGPSVILSFLIAAIASVFAGLCYAEFGARVPRAGSAYIYSYVCVGECIAFVIGWNLILEYVIGSASVARGLSLYLDTLINNTMENTFRDIAPINIPYLSEYFDFFAFGIAALLSIAMAFGMKESNRANSVFTLLNIGVVLFVIIAGSIKADVANWNIQPDPNNSTNSTIIGKGGFFPFGVEGMIKGAATCFYGFVGFDCIATTGEEVKNPKKAIPVSIIVSLFIIFLAYFGTSTVVTLMVPYYLQDPNAPIPYAFEHIGWNTAKWIVSIGGIFGLCASLFGAMFPLPRIIYAMASDSLVFKFLGKIHSKFHTPVVGTLFAGLLTGLMAAMFELKQLVNMMSIGTLLAYTIVAACVLLLRYAREESRQYLPVQTTSDSDDSETYTDNKISINSDEDTNNEEQELLHYTTGSVIGQIFNCGRYKNPTKISEMIVTIEIFIYCIMCIFIGLCAIYLKTPITNGEIWAIVLTSVVILITVILIMSLVTQPTSNKELSFKVPFVPLVPALSILINIYLMLMLDTHTWIRFAVWMAIGLPIYYFSIRPYTEAQNKNISNKSSIDYNISMVNHTQNGKLNGHTNIAFVSDDETIRKDDNSEDKETKKMPAPQPPTKNNGHVDNNEIPSEITKLDEMLEEVSNTINSNSIGRKLSVGTLSNVSDIVSREENVVAVVHRDNVITPANSNAPPSPTDVKNISFPDDNGLTSDNLDKTDKIILNIDKSSLTGDSLASEEDKTKYLPISTPPPSLNSSPLPRDKIDNEHTPLPPPLPSFSYGDVIATPPQSPNSSPMPKDKIKSEYTLLPLPLPALTNEEFIAAPRPTSANLHSVTLRPVKHKEVVEDEQHYEPDDDNLKVGSDKYKSFMSRLNGKLQKLNVLPSYIPYITKNAPQVEVKQEEKVPNENVIEKSLDREVAKEKIGQFLRDSYKVRDIIGIYNEGVKTDENNEKHGEDNGIRSNNELTREISIEVNDEDGGEGRNDDQNSNSDYMDHQNRMQNVFRSINLKKVESFKDPAIKESRNAKSLGSSFMNDDKMIHRQAMGEIFKTIKLRRKDSSKKKDDSKE
ncbi:hypothetical protein NQ314_003199 [Rhamnusium bicolor]|uniref:Cationic amino acid transporter C-terminal domain-containing protein n=1 Tax=Rhamnusium bicolor TaxID=1586634 RepID=A0AAV8ZN26_9CUCU|nr:hypothetical protein NQ314_003199 [Rhamnusium bicolor]